LFDNPNKRQVVKALLDFPWELTEVLEPYSEALDTLRRFSVLVSTNSLEPARFVDQVAEATLRQSVNERGRGGNVYSSVAQFLSHCRCEEALGLLQANPEPCPNPLPTTWKQALRDSMRDLADWRVPQIVVSSSRLTFWTTQEGQVAIRCEDRPEELHHRVLAGIDSYADHQFASSDFDPWDLRRRYPAEGGRHVDHPCRLPRPPMLNGALLRDLDSKLEEARSIGWRSPGRRYFIPPANWHWREVDKVAWRSGHLFPQKTLNERNGPVDYLGNVWHWHNEERHWDVQLIADGYVRISHTGVQL
jgi:hypothetical protein